MNLAKALEKEQLRDDLPDFSVGDRVRVIVRVKEGEKERDQAFDGTVIARKHGGINETFTVRRVSSGEGMERILQFVHINTGKKRLLLMIRKNSFPSIMRPKWFKTRIFHEYLHL